MPNISLIESIKPTTAQDKTTLGKLALINKEILAAGSIHFS